MNFQKYRRLKKAALAATTYESFIRQVAESAFWFGVPLWNKENYRWFYERIKGGARYDSITNELKKAA